MFAKTPSKTLLPEELPRQFAVMLPSRSGSFSSIVKLLKANGIEIIGFSARNSQDLTILRLVTSNPEDTERIFLEKGIPHAKTEIAVAGIPNPSEDLQRLLNLLLESEVTIHSSYPLLPSPQGRALIALHVEDAFFAANTLSKAGFQILRQKDISR